MRINLDMDGTISNLYEVEDWLSQLRAENPDPYRNARPLVNMSRLARYLNKLTRLGIEIAIISWGSKQSTDEYLAEVTKAKREWLAKHLPSVTFTEIAVVHYGTPKSTCGYGILFDDEEPNRAEWGEGAYAETEIFEVMKNIIKGLDR